MQSPIPLGEKIMQIRVAKNLTQENLAYGIGRNAVFISRIENGQVEITPETLAGIRIYLGIEKAPLLEHERSIYKSRLWVWRGLLNARRFNEANDMQNELSCILHLPFEGDLKIMYQMIESKMLFVQKDFAAVVERLDSAEVFWDEMSEEALYLYHYTKGSLYYYQGNTIKALEYMQKTLEIKIPDINEDSLLLANIGDMYSNLGKPFHALSFLERAKLAYNGDHTNPFGAMIDSVIAACHLQIGDYDRSRKIFESSLAQARTTNNHETFTATLLSDLALAYLNLGNYDEALKLCEESLMIAADVKSQYMISLTCKIKILMKMNQMSKAKSAILEGKALAVGEAEIFGIVFETFEHLMNLNADESTTYLETVAIPYLRGTLQNFMALEICDALEAYYKKKKAKIKSLAIGVVSRDIYRGMVDSI